MDLGYCEGSKSEKTALLEDAKDKNQRRKHIAHLSNSNRSIDERKQQLAAATTRATFVGDRQAAASRPVRGDPDYGRPPEGTLTAARGARAHTHVHKEILELCEVINVNGLEDVGDGGTAVMLFGDLFRLYTRISDKVVGILLRAKKYGLVYFEPEMLFQGQHDDTPVFLTRSMQDIYDEYNTNKAFGKENNNSS